MDSLSVMTFDVNNFTLSWKKPIHSNGEIVKYEVAWNVMPGSHDGGESDSKTLSKIEVSVRTSTRDDIWHDTQQRKIESTNADSQPLVFSHQPSVPYYRQDQRR